MATDANQIIAQANRLFEEVMQVYWAYLDELEKLIKETPEGNEEVIGLLNEKVDEIQRAIVHDIEVFEKAAENDIEDIHQLKDQLKMQEIYKKLNHEV